MLRIKQCIRVQSVHQDSFRVAVATQRVSIVTLDNIPTYGEKTAAGVAHLDGMHPLREGLAAQSALQDSPKATTAAVLVKNVFLGGTVINGVSTIAPTAQLANLQ